MDKFSLYVLLFASIVLATYNWDLPLEPDKLLFGGQLVIWWFILRYTLKRFPQSVWLCITGILFSGLLEAALGTCQLYGLASSNHPLFQLTGSFMNPGPYSGYLAVILPVCLGAFMKFRANKNRRIPQSLLYYFSWLCLIAIIAILPAGMSRSAWIAAALSCGYVYAIHSNQWEQLIRIWRSHRIYAIAGMILIVVILLVGGIGMYHLKKDSADGRLLMWKITTKAIVEHPVEGVGLGGFPAAYAKTQAEYFASGQGSPTEKFVAGSPEYAFNEYLQIGLEQGLAGLAVFLLWMGSCLFLSIKNRRYGVAGGILSLLIFAFSSYPLQLTEFWIVLIVLAVLGITPPKKQETIYTTKKRFPWIVLICVVGSLILSGIQVDRYRMHKQWEKARPLYYSQAYEAAAKAYLPLYSKLNHKPEFLFELAQCMSKTGQYAEANRLLERATQLSADPMLNYMIAKNEQQLGHYREAEQQLLHGINILPERIYPYYLLTLLYADTACFQPEKMRAAADSVLLKVPKVETTATREMRDEVRKLLSKKNNLNE